jgi:hypothetical protein
MSYWHASQDSGFSSAQTIFSLLLASAETVVFAIEVAGLDLR